jgi:hypothetical protein
MNNNWLAKNTFHYSDFKDLNRLVEEKVKKNLKISLCLPTLNEEKTIAKEIIILKSELMTRYSLLDEIVVVDSGSTDIWNNIRAKARICGRRSISRKGISSFTWMRILKISITASPMVYWARCCSTITLNS